MIAVITVVALATFSTRVLPFVLFRSVQPPKILFIIEKNLPPMILLLLVFYCLKDTQWSQSPYGIPEIFTIIVIIVLHVWKRNAMISIFTGTCLYMLSVKYNVFSNLFL
ncbi:MAG: AzlD domain-containing protein [Methanomethylovorans sp.]|uniref:branched-chain amino acid transporter permease n=1 Tax=Methanomethylovorans sp. TaxID=2758717 RepID=UPI00345E8C0A